MKQPCLALSLAVLLAGCAHQLPSEEAKAFKTLAAADRDSFQAMANAEAESVKIFVGRQLLNGSGSVAPSGCDQSRPKDNCAIIWRSSTPPQTIRLETTAANTRELIGALADYGEQMATLAEAEDVAKAQESLGGVGTAINGLMTAAGLPVIGTVIVDAAVWIGKGRMIEKRRRALLEAATKANPAVQTIASRMEAISKNLQNNLTVTAGNRINDGVLLLAEPKSSRQERASAFADMTDAATDLQAARELSTDYKALGEAHSKLLVALSDPSASTADVLADLKTFLGFLEAARNAGKATEEK